MVAAIFCVLPCYVVSGLLMLTTPLIVEKRLGAVDAMKQSWAALQPDWLTATLFMFVLPLLSSLGAFACGVGLLFTMPLLFLGQAVVYADLFPTETEAAEG
jgi:uncharacterized membrane protein